MNVTFPAMKARMGEREYFCTTMALSEIPRFFKFTDWEQITPELRAQRVLNESRVPVLAKYINDNEDSYLFSSITCSYQSDIEFSAFSENEPDIGLINLDLEKMEFVINDGQHRCAAIAQAIKENPTLGKDRISVLLFPMEDLERMQQMFADLNRHAQRSSKSLNILYDQRDPLNNITISVVENVSVFKGMVDSEKVSLPIRSHKLFTLASIYDANKEFLNRISIRGTEPEYEDLETNLITYWNELSENMEDWKAVANRDVPPSSVRQEKISSHSVILRALGNIGGILLKKHPETWKDKISKIRDVDWRKSVGTKLNPLWDGACLTAGSVVSNKQARLATLNVLIKALDIDMKSKKQQL